jgi:hypothetical protein
VGGSELGIETGVTAGAGVTAVGGVGAGIGVGAVCAKASDDAAAISAAPASEDAMNLFMVIHTYPLRRAFMNAIVRSTASGASPT